MKSSQDSQTSNVLIKLIGKNTEYKSDLSDINTNLGEIDVKVGNFIEKYFNEKSKYLLKSKPPFLILLKSPK